MHSPRKSPRMQKKAKTTTNTKLNNFERMKN